MCHFFPVLYYDIAQLMNNLGLVGICITVLLT